MQDEENRGYPDDPRPVFEGDWAKANGKERGEHRTRVNAWYQRHPEERPSAKGGGKGGAKGQSAKGGAQSRIAAGDGQPERDADDLRHLDAIIHSSALASDRIRAIEAKQRILNRQEAEQLQQEHGPLVALRDALSALPSEDRVDALLSLVRVGDAAEAEA